MKSSVTFALALFLIGSVAALANAQPPAAAAKAAHQEGKKMIAKGTFEVKITPLKDEEAVADGKIQRLSIAKTFTGDIVGTSRGQMLGIGTDIKDSGAYVAAEVVTATLDGKKGTFSLYHNGTMQGGNFDLQVRIVPDSGTDALKGIKGSMKIVIEGGKHFYELEYFLPN